VPAVPGIAPLRATASAHGAFAMAAARSRPAPTDYPPRASHFLAGSARRTPFERAGDRAIPVDQPAIALAASFLM